MASKKKIPYTAEEEAATASWIHDHWDTPDEEGLSPLHRAVARNDGTYVRALLLKGESANATNPTGETPLAVAVRRPNGAAVVQMLILGGATVKHQNIVATSAVDHIPYLLKNGASLEERDAEGYTPFLRAVEQNDDVKMYYLMDLRCDRNAITSQGQDALALAVQNGDRTMVSLLLFRGLEPSTPALDQACHILLESGRKERS